MSHPSKNPATDLRQTLTESLDQARLDWLVPHLDKDVVIWVDAALELVDVGMAIATDDSNSVRRWIEEQFLIKPTPETIANWDAHQRFQALIVQPYILIRDLPTDIESA
jgi:hypothetical protein